MQQGKGEGLPSSIDLQPLVSLAHIRFDARLLQYLRHSHPNSLSTPQVPESCPKPHLVWLGFPRRSNDVVFAVEDVMEAILARIVNADESHATTAHNSRFVSLLHRRGRAGPDMTRVSPIPSQAALPPRTEACRTKTFIRGLVHLNTHLILPHRCIMAGANLQKQPSNQAGRCLNSLPLAPSEYGPEASCHAPSQWEIGNDFGGYGKLDQTSNALK
jgi:hypothetical protein